MLVVDDDSEGRPVARIVERVEDGSPAGTTRTAAEATRLAEEGGPPPAALNRLFRDVAREVTSAVVSIRVQSQGEGQQSPRGMEPEDLFGNPPPQQNLGSGVLISPDGYIVTNNHVVDRGGTIVITLADKRQFEGRLVGTDSSTDLAVIKIDGETDFPVLPLGNSDQMKVGDWVVAVGNPFRLTSTVTAGIVSALGRQVGIIEDNFRVENFIQTDAAINPGNSGGALVNLQGELVGINTAIASKTGAYEGYGFAIPATLVDRVATDLIAYGEVRRGYLGVSIGEVNAQVAQEVGLDEIKGVYVNDVRRGSAADRAGLQGGDIVVSVMGEPVDARNKLQSLIARKRPGDVVSVTVWREGVERDFDVQLMGKDTPVYQEWLSDLRSSPGSGSTPSLEPPDDERQPESEEAAVTELDEWAVGLRSLQSEEQSDFEVEAGVYVAYVENGGQADAAGLPRDVVITHLNETQVESPADVIQYLSDTTGPVLVQVQRRDGTKAFYDVD